MVVEAPGLTYLTVSSELTDLKVKESPSAWLAG